MDIIAIGDRFKMELCGDGDIEVEVETRSPIGEKLYDYYYLGSDDLKKLSAMIQEGLKRCQQRKK